MKKVVASVIMLWSAAAAAQTPPNNWALIVTRWGGRPASVTTGLTAQACSDLASQQNVVAQFKSSGPPGQARPEIDPHAVSSAECVQQ